MKFKQNATNNKTGKTTDHYMHTSPVQEVKDALENDNTSHKLKHKVRK